MQKIILALISFPLLAANLAYAEEAPQAAIAAPKPVVSDMAAKNLSPSVVCPSWVSNVHLDQESLDKLRTKSSAEKPENGESLTKDQLIVLLGKNLVGARDTLARNKNKLHKTSDGLVDLRDATLNGFDLSELNLDRVDLRGAELKGANLSGSSLNYSILYKANLDGANLDRAKINFSNVIKTSLIGAHLCEATLLYTDVEEAVFRGSYMKGAKLETTMNLPSVMYLYSKSIFEVGLPVPPNHFE